MVQGVGLASVGMGAWWRGRSGRAGQPRGPPRRAAAGEASVRSGRLSKGSLKLLPAGWTGEAARGRGAVTGCCIIRAETVGPPQHCGHLG